MLLLTSPCGFDTGFPLKVICVKVYIQGTNEWENSGNGWQFISNPNLSSAQLLQSQLPSVQLAALGNITPSILDDGYQYTAQLNLQSDDSFLNQVMNSLPSPSGSSSEALTPAQFATILKNSSGSVLLTVASIQGSNVITNEQTHLTMNVPATMLFAGTTPEEQQMLQDISSVTVNASLTAGFMYNALQIAPPAGLPSSPSTAS